MRLKDFYLDYNLLDLNIKHVLIKDNTLILEVEMEVYLEYIANGLRSNFDMNPVHRFIFNIDHEDLELFEPIKVTAYSLDDTLNITLNDINLVIVEQDIKCKQNIHISK